MATIPKSPIEPDETIRFGDLPQENDANPGTYNILNFKKIDADTAARQIKLSKETGIPWSAIMLPGKEDQVRRNQAAPDPETMIRQAPKTYQFLQDYQNAAIVGPDHPELSSLEKRVKEDQPILEGRDLFDEQSPTFVGTAGREVAPFINKTSKSITAGGKDVVAMRAGAKALLHAFDDEVDFVIESERIAAKKEAELHRSPEAESLAQRIGIETGRMLPMVVETVKSGGITGVAGGLLTAGGAAGLTLAAGNLSPLAVFPEEAFTLPAAASWGFKSGYGVFATAGAVKEMFVFNAGEAFNSIVDLEDENGDPIDRKVAGVAAAVAGGINAGLDFVGLKYLPGGDALLGKLSKTAIISSLRNPTVRAALARIASKYAAGVTVEALTEMAQEGVLIFAESMSKTIQESATDTIFSRPDLVEEALPRIVNAGTSAALAAIGLGGIGTIYTAPIELSRANIKASEQFAKAAQAQIYHDKVIGLAEEINQGKVKLRSPETTEAHLGLIGAGADVYISPEFFQEGNEEAARISAAIGIDPQVAEKNRSIGIDTVAKLSKVLSAELTPEDLGLLAQDIKPSPGAYTQRQISAMDIKADLQEISAKYKEVLSENQLIAQQARRIKKEGGIEGAGLPAHYMDDFINFFTSFRYTPRKMSELLERVKIRAAKAPEGFPYDVKTEQEPLYVIESDQQGVTTLSKIKPSEEAVPVFAAVQNPMTVDRITPEAIQQAMQAGHDGIISGDNVVVFRPDQISTATGPILYQWDEPWYSALERTLSDPKFPEKSSGEEYLRMFQNKIRQGEVKADEIQWSGLRNLLSGPEKWTKKELLEYVRLNKAEIEFFDFADRRVSEEDLRERLYEDDEIMDRAYQAFAEDFYRGRNGFDDWVYYELIDRSKDVWDDPDDFYWDESGTKKEDYLPEDEDPTHADLSESFAKFQEDFFNEGLRTQFAGKEEFLYNLESSAWSEFAGDYVNEAIDHAVESFDFDDDTGPKFEEYTLGYPEDYKEWLFRFENRLDVKNAKNTAFFKRMAKKYNKKDITALDLSEEDLQKYYAIVEERGQGKRFEELHWDDEGADVIFHMRASTRETHDGKKIFFVDEVQSQLHQLGRKYGYIGDPIGPLTAQKNKVSDEVFEVFYRDGLHFTTIYRSDFLNNDLKPSEENAILLAEKKSVSNPNDTSLSKRPPKSPLSKQWALTAMKRAVFEAARQGFDGIGWTTGKIQTGIYSSALRKSVDTIEWLKLPDGKIRLIGYKNSRVIFDSTETRSALPDAVGVTMSRKILKDTEDTGAIEGRDLVISDTGMAGFYDGRLPFEVSSFFGKKTFGKPKLTKTAIKSNDFQAIGIDPEGLYNFADILDAIGNADDAEKIRQYAAKKGLLKDEIDAVTEIMDSVPSFEYLHPVWFLPITPELKKQAENGFALYQSDQSKPRGSFIPTPTEYIISLFENRDLSSLLHETGHLFYKEFETLVMMGIATAQQQEDFRTLHEWMGVENGKAPEREHLEKFAKGFETYLWEGKAPTVELESIFYRFRQWLRHIYKNARVALTDEVRGVFDRMLADEASMDSAAFSVGYDMPTTEQLDTLGVIPEDREYMRRLLTKAKESSEKKMIKERDANRRKNLKVWRKIAEEDLARHPVYAFVEEVKAQGGLNREALVEQFGEQSVRAMPTGFAVKNSMLHPALAVDIIKVPQAGQVFTSVSKMAREIAKLPSRSQFIKTQIAALSADHDAQYRPLDYLLRSDEYAAYFEILAKYANRGKVGAITPRKAFKIYAAKELDKMDVAQAIRHDRFLATMKKNSRIETDKARQGKWAEAAQANELVRLNYEFVGQAIKNRKKVEKLIAKINAVTRKKKKGREGPIDYQYLENIKALALRFELTNAIPDNIAEKAKLADLITDPDGLFDNGGAFPAWLVSETFSDRYQNLTMQEFTDLSNLINFLIGKGRYVKNAMLSSGKATVAQAAKDIAALTAFLPKSAYKKVHKRFSFLRSITEKSRKIFASMDSFQNIMISMGAYKSVGPEGQKTVVDEYIIDPLIAAQDQELVMKKDLSRRLHPHLLTLHKAVLRMRKEHGGEIALTGMEATPQLLVDYGQDGWWTPEQIIAMALNQGNEGNKARLLSGYEGLSQATVDSLIDLLEVNEMDAVQGILDIINSYFSMTDSVHRKIKYYPMEKVEATPIRTSKGEWPGGYYPIAYDKDLSSKIKEWNTEDDLLSRSEAIFRTPAAKSGFSKTREVTTKYPLRLSVAVASSHLMDVIHYITHAETIRDVDAITRKMAFKQAAEKLLGAEVYEMIRPALKHIARPEREFTTYLDRGVEVARKYTTPYILAWNTGSAFKQIFGGIPAMFELGPKEFAIAHAKMLTSPAASYLKMLELSPYMEGRATAFDREIFQQFGALTPGQKAILFGDKAVQWDDVVNFGFWPLRIADMAVITPLWHGGYSKELKKSGDHAKAIKAADDIVRRTQPSAMPFDLSEALRSGGVWRAISLFGTWSIGTYNQRQRLHYRAWRSKQLTTKDYVWFNFCDHVIPALGLELLFAYIYGKAFDDEETWWDMFAGWIQFTLLTGLPIISQMFTRRGQAVDSPLLATPTRVKQAIMQGAKYLETQEEEDLTKTFWGFLDVGSIAFRVPVSAVVRKANRGAQQTDNESPFKYIIPAPPNE